MAVFNITSNYEKKNINSDGQSFHQCQQKTTIPHALKWQCLI
jgi:hypothetical protein